MKPLYYLFIIVFSGFIHALHAKSLSTKEMVAQVGPIEHLAMQYGEGDIKAYVFVDPKCPHSRDFISMLHDNEKMRHIYRYYIFFYELKRFNSHKLIGTIYGSKVPLQTTLEIMVAGKEVVPHLSIMPQIEEKMGQIETVAQQLGVNKRPYLIISKEWD